MVAALINALKLVDKKIEDIKIVINGAGAAGISICRYLLSYGAQNVLICDRKGIICEGDEGLNPAQEDISHCANKEHVHGLLKDAMVGADVFIGVSGPNCVTPEMIKSMNEKSIVFPLANPVPEINPDLAKEAGAYIIGTGSSEYANQINNVLVFPGLFRGAIDARAKTINREMMVAVSEGIASCVSKEELNRDFILPYPYDKRAHVCVAEKVKEAAIRTGVVKK